MDRYKCNQYTKFASKWFEPDKMLMEVDKITFSTDIYENDNRSRQT